MTSTFWNGYRSDEVRTANAYIPITGEADHPSLENFRVFQNGYYRFYNDGDIPNYHQMKRIAKTVGVSYVTHDRESSLEEIGTALLDAVLEEIDAGIIVEKPTSPMVVK